MIRVEDNLYNSSFPQQKLSLKKKNEKWQHDCVNYIIGEGNVVSGGYTKTRFGELQTYYNLYNSIFDEKDFYYNIIQIQLKYIVTSKMNTKILIKKGFN